MKLLALVLLLSSAVGCYSWEVDPRCPGVNRRLKKTSKKPTLSSEDNTSSLLLEEQLDEVPVEKERNLRGEGVAEKVETEAEIEEDADVHYLEERHLMSETHFNLKMYWEEGFCWQEEYDIHRKWCMQCEGDVCGVDDILWIQYCRHTPEQKFKFIVDGNDSSVGRIKTSTNNLCLQRVSANFYKLKHCSSSRMQLFRGFRRDRPFELQPIHDSTKCLNQHHHPKRYEEIYTTDCKLARKYKTNKWEIYFEEDDSTPELGSGPQLDSDIIECSSDRECDACQGDCDHDSDCRGRLECYQRADHNPWDIVFGCTGYGQKGVDYCVDPYRLSNYDDEEEEDEEDEEEEEEEEDEQEEEDDEQEDEQEEEEEGEEEEDEGEGGSGNNESIRLDPEIISCSPSRKCDRCQGDCDSDRDCEGDLVCFQKNRGQTATPVPGCIGSDRSRTDYCVDPKDL